MFEDGESIGENGGIVSDNLSTYYELECRNYDESMGNDLHTTFNQMKAEGFVNDTEMKAEVVRYYNDVLKPRYDLEIAVSRLINDHSSEAPIAGDTGLYQRVIDAINRSNVPGASLQSLEEAVRDKVSEDGNLVLDDLMQHDRESRSVSTLGVPKGKKL